MEATMDLERARKSLLEFILSGKREEAIALLDGWARLSTYNNAISDILEPVLGNIGDMWVAEKISLAAGYLAGKIAEDTLMKAHQNEQAVPETKGPVILGNVEDDYHSLGRKLVGIFLRTAGWKVIDLGNDVTAAEFVDAAVNNNSKVIAVSAMMFTTARNIIKIRQEIDKRGLTDQIKLGVGGAVFKIRPELVAEVGGDGTAVNAMNTPELMERLWR
jgi:methylmalonyl-CoA mutase cobalamin-binding domain/chain